MNKIMLILLSTFCWLLVGLIYVNIINNIEKHSVHPLYGNYKKFNSELNRCSPWESCE